MFVFFFKQKTAYEMRISDWSSDVCSSDLHVDAAFGEMTLDRNPPAARGDRHALVIVAVAAPAGEGVAEPEIVVGGDCVGDVGEARGALDRKSTRLNSSH